MCRSTAARTTRGPAASGSPSTSAIISSTLPSVRDLAPTRPVARRHRHNATMRGATTATASASGACSTSSTRLTVPLAHNLNSMILDHHPEIGERMMHARRRVRGSRAVELRAPGRHVGERRGPPHRRDNGGDHKVLGKETYGLDEPVAIAEPPDARSVAGGRIPLSMRLAARRPADLDAYAPWQDPEHALSGRDPTTPR